MAYIENRTVHDADSHVMEMPDKILEYLEPSYREEFISEANKAVTVTQDLACLLYTSPSPRDATLSRMPSSA